ncbi:MaoC family dehydratase [Natrialbaceae archaeon A-gly3]
MSGTETDAVTPFELTQRWADASQTVLASWLAAGQDVLTAFGSSTRSAPPGTDGANTAIDDVVETDLEWETERSVDVYEDLAVGDVVRFTKTFTDGDVTTFAISSGDTNRLHLEDTYADGTRFGGRILHGTLVAGTISAALARLPGLTVYLSQDLEFQAPVEPGDTVTAECTIIEDLGNDQYRLSTTVSDADGEAVIDGEAVVLVDEHPES